MNFESNPLEVPEIPEEQALEEVESVETPKLSRRHFLRSLGRAAVGLTAASFVAQGNAEAGEQPEKKVEKDQNAEKLLRQSWEDYKEVIKNGNVRENIEYIEKELGEKGGGITFYPKFILQTFDTLVDAEKSGEDIFNDPKYTDILKIAISEYNDAWNRTELRSRGEKSESPLVFEGFEKRKDVNIDELRAYLEEKYMKSWLLGSVDKIIYVDEEENRKTYGVAGAAAGRGLDGSIQKSTKQFIYIYKSSNDIKELLAHELAHHNDWYGSHNLTLAERLEFLRNVIENHKREDTPRYDYVERVTVEEGKANDLPESEIKVAQITEYWAMLCENYFTNSAEFYLKSPESHSLVSRWYLRINSK